MNASPSLSVVKIGGSLFARADLADRLRGWLARQPPSPKILIAGGGSLVEAIRERDRTAPLDATTAHWLCIDQMSVMARILSDLLPEIPLATDVESLRRPNDAPPGARIMAFDSARFLRELEPFAPGTTLPASWDVTSDSIAARLAVVLAADRLVLAKSVAPPAAELASVAEFGYVDRFLPRLVGELPPVVAVDLSSDDFVEYVLRAPSPSGRGAG
jgi:aspartokinase-like uncharacterized kinase